MHELFRYHSRDICSQISDNKIFWVSLISAIITFFAVLSGLFKEWFLSILFKPKLIFKAAKTVSQSNSYFMYRLLVFNDGQAAAHDVRAIVSNVTIPINLNWTHINNITRDISKKEPAYLDVIKEENGKLYFYSAGSVIDLPEYSLSNSKKIKITIDFFEINCSLQKVTLELNPLDKTLTVVS